MNSRTKAEMYEELNRSGDELALVKAACDSTEIIINGQPFEPEGAVRSDELSDLLNASLDLVGNTAIFKFADGSFLKVTVVYKTGRESGTVWIESGLLEQDHGE